MPGKRPRSEKYYPITNQWLINMNRSSINFVFLFNGGNSIEYTVNIVKIVV